MYFFIIRHVQIQWKRFCNFHVILLLLMIQLDHYLSNFLYLTTAGAKCHVTAVKRYTVFTWVGIYYKSLISATSSVGHWVSLNPVQGTRGMMHIIRHVQSQWNRVSNFHFIFCDKCFRGITLYTYFNKCSPERHVPFFCHFLPPGLHGPVQDWKIGICLEAALSLAFWI
jgi:hypothetical protein